MLLEPTSEGLKKYGGRLEYFPAVSAGTAPSPTTGSVSNEISCPSKYLFQRVSETPTRYEVPPVTDDLIESGLVSEHFFMGVILVALP